MPDFLHPDIPRVEIYAGTMIVCRATIGTLAVSAALSG
jgi:hypothetical protein